MHTFILKAIQRYPLVAYFVMAYLGTWLVWTPAILSSYGLGIVDIPIIVVIGAILLGTFTGPTLATLLLISSQTGAEGRQQIWRQIIRWRLNPIWYLVAFLMPLAVNLLADLITLAIASPSFVGPSVAAIPGNLITLGAYILTALTVVIGTMPEEIGWRGYALPRLQQRVGPLYGTLLLGFVWGCWHLPFLLWSEEFRGVGHPPLPYFIGYIPMTMALAVFMTVIYNYTQGSLLATALLHAAFNTASTSASTLLFGRFEIGGLPSAETFYEIFVWMFVGLAILAILTTHGRLGYDT